MSGLATKASREKEEKSRERQNRWLVLRVVRIKQAKILTPKAFGVNIENYYLWVFRSVNLPEAGSGCAGRITVC
jgi:hypothetical protein